MAKTLPSADQLHCLFKYSPDGRLIWKPRGIPSWDSKWAGKFVADNLTAKGYRRVSLCSGNALQHRVIWKMHHGTDPECIDHINGDRSDNRISNLRAVTFGQNAMACRKNLSVTGYKGVIKASKSKGYEARIKKDRKQIHLGTFKTAEDAARAYDIAALATHKKYAITNESLGLL